MVAASGLLLPRGSISIMELGPQSHSKDGLSIPNSIMVVYMDPLGKQQEPFNAYLEIQDIQADRN